VAVDIATLRVAYLGNFGADHSTENEIRKAWQARGATVLPIQEGEVRAVDVVKHAAAFDADLFLWTQTYGLAETGGTNVERLRMLDDLAGIPTVGVHLDRFWGLAREPQVTEQAFFRVGLLFTADGGHDEQWADVGINHRWLPPAVSEFECVDLPDPDPDYPFQVAFVGNHTGGYHREWRHRRDLIRWLRRRYGPRLDLVPRRGEGGMRGQELARLYRSVPVVVGDSCLVGDRGRTLAGRYWSDRIPETVGRGGFLLHPAVEGLDWHFTDGQHLRTWDVGDWDRLGGLIDHYLADVEGRDEIRAAGRAHVLQHHTYTVRVGQIVDALVDEGML